MTELNQTLRCGISSFLFLIEAEESYLALVVSE